jgi:hypothetical protein
LNKELKKVPQSGGQVFSFRTASKEELGSEINLENMIIVKSISKKGGFFGVIPYFMLGSK